MAKYIYFVGKPYPYLEEIMRALGNDYKFCLFLDRNVTLRNPGKYDEVVELDFSSPEIMFASLASKDLKVDGLVCTYENYIMARTLLAEHFNVAAPSLEAARMSTDKFLMRQAFKRFDPSITPDFGLASSANEAIQLAERLSYPVILKPTNLVKSLLVLRCNNQKELADNFTYAEERIVELYKKYKVYAHKPKIIIEKYIQGTTCSVAAFIDKNGKVHMCDGIVSLDNAQDIGVEDNYIYRRSLAGQLNKDQETKLFQTARKGIEALQLTSTPAHVELIYNDDGVKIIEIGARIGGYRPRMYAISYGLDLIAEEINLALGKTPNLSGKFKAYCAVYELFPKTEGNFKDIKGFTNTAKFTYYAVKAKARQRIGPAKNGYKAAAVIIISSPSNKEFYQICETVDTLEVRTS